MKAKYLATALAVVLSATLTGCGSGSPATDTTPTVSVTPTESSSTLRESECLVIADRLVKVQDVLSGLGKTSTIEDAANTLKDASEHWSTEASIATVPEAATWLNNMSEQAAMLRVKLDSGDIGPEAIAIAKELNSYMSENSTFCK